VTRRRAAWAPAAAVLALGLVPWSATAQEQLETSIAVDPPVVRLGETATVRAEVVVWRWGRVRWLPPEPGEDLTWGARRAGVAHGAVGRTNARGPARIESRDTVWVEIPVQAFQLGVHEIPGLRFEYVAARSAPELRRVPAARLTVIPTLTAADSNATFRGLHGPLAAPWWERVPWRLVVLAGLLIGALAALIVWLRRRRKPVVAPVRAPAPVVRLPGAEALAALAKLRAQKLPEQGRFAEHAYQLGQILRRFLESTVGVTRPGDTTPELLDHLREARLDAESLQRLAGLLRVWDRVKFAREPMTVDEAIRTEAAVEAFVRRPEHATRQVA
jgi:hypothetical protein